LDARATRALEGSLIQRLTAASIVSVLARVCACCIA